MQIHEMRVEVGKEDIVISFYEKAKGGKRLVGRTHAPKNDKVAIRAAIETEHAFALDGKGSRRLQADGSR